ncbi:ATP-dependent Clp protease adaptor ClpS [Paenibacillus cymbidii]|uniref:ATP-dependent Clp protease adaptor ClpS n=1 Tax=Paenibacillus cymbidii TaxID=1639034 RepID=UPI001081E6F0|nr:ATP-dependent Clp protease adaptor ClpS [Paenibacillus cymbidii]
MNTRKKGPSVLVDENVSYLITKPDCLNNPAVINDLKSQLHYYNLEIIGEFTITLSRHEVTLCWPDYVRYPVTLHLLFQYIADRPLGVYLLKGNDAINKTSEIKKIVRSRYAQHAFANCIHTPSNKQELLLQLKVIEPRMGMKVEYSMPIEPDSVVRDEAILPGIWGGLAKITGETFHEVIDSVWKSLGNLHEFKEGIETQAGEEQALLFNDDTNGIDYVASCLIETFPDWTPERAIITVLKVDQTGSACLYSGDKEKISDIIGKLNGLNLQVKAVRIQDMQ